MAFEKNYEDIFGLNMAYHQDGAGDPIVFLHGNPASSYIWRNIIPHVSNVGRCIAPDLIGMGDSAKLSVAGPGSYRFRDHSRYLDALLARLGVNSRVTLVGQDWGSALMFDWANRHRDAVKGLVHMESIVMPWTRKNFPIEGVLESHETLRSAIGETLILDSNEFIESIPRMVVRTLTASEMEEYRRPFREVGEGRRPTLSWPREIPFEGEPLDVFEIVEGYAKWLADSHVPKLFINAEPGLILTGAHRDFVRSWKNQEEVTVRGLHFVQEDAPHEIGNAIVKWYRGLA
jgi:haloalkane dehalogenase